MKNFFNALSRLAGVQPKTFKLAGKAVLDSDGSPLPYVTIFLTPAGEKYRPDGVGHQKASADLEGNFTFCATKGTYTLTLIFLGCETKQVEVPLTADTTLGNIVLESHRR